MSDLSAPGLFDAWLAADVDVSAPGRADASSPPAVDASARTSCDVSTEYLPDVSHRVVWRPGTWWALSWCWIALTHLLHRPGSAPDTTPHAGALRRVRRRRAVRRAR